LSSLGVTDAHRIGAAIEHLREHGPSLGWPRAASISRSRHHNMKEPRSAGGHLRALFAFDPRRRAVILLGGDKTKDWKGWYVRNIPLADKLYERHLRSIGKGRTVAGPNQNRREIREQRPLNEDRVAMYGRLMDAEDRLDAVRRRRGISETALGDALD
jgi:hypothetical protein